MAFSIALFEISTIFALKEKQNHSAVKVFKLFLRPFWDYFCRCKDFNRYLAQDFSAWVRNQGLNGNLIDSVCKTTREISLLYILLILDGHLRKLAIGR